MFIDVFTENSAMYDGAGMNASELDSIAAAAVDESLSVGEQFYQFALENEANWQKYQMALIGHEVKAMAEGGNIESVVEAVDFASMRDTFVKWLETAWSKIKAAFEKAIAWLDDAFRGTSKVLANAKKVKNQDRQIATVKLYGCAGHNGDKFFNDPDSWRSFLQDVAEAADTADAYNFHQFDNKKACEKFIEDAAKVKDNAKSTAADIKGETYEEKLTIKMAIAAIDGGRVAGGVRKAAAVAKSFYEKALKSCKSIKTNLKKESDADVLPTAMKALSAKQKCLRICIGAVDAASRVICSCSNHNFNVCVRVLRKAVGRSGSKDEDSKAKNEGATILADFE